MFVWQAITNDEYELPLAQAETLRELAAKFDIDYKVLRKHYSKYNRSYTTEEIRFLKIELEEDYEY